VPGIGLAIGTNALRSYLRASLLVIPVGLLRYMLVVMVQCSRADSLPA